MHTKMVETDVSESKGDTIEISLAPGIGVKTNLGDADVDSNAEAKGEGKE